MNSETKSDREPFTVVALAALVLALIAAASLLPDLAPAGAFDRPWLLAMLAIAGGLGAVHRPWGGAGLGLGSAAVALGVVDAGVAPAAGFAVAASLLGEAVRRRLAAGMPERPAERRGLLRVAGEAAVVGAAALAAGTTWVALGSRAAPFAATAVAAAAVSYVGVLLAGELLLARARGERLLVRLLQLLPPLVVETVAWLTGLLLALVAVRVDSISALALLGAGTMLVLEAVRQAHRHGLAERHAQDLQRVSRAAERRLAGDRPLAPMAAIAEQVRGECRSVVPFEWFELELPDGSGGRVHWRGAREGALSNAPWGSTGPSSAPPALPGFHRRGSWEVLERTLRVEGQALGTLRLWSDPRLIQASARRLLEDLLPQMAASIERAILDREAKVDALTGVAVRRVLEARLQEAFRAASEEGSALSVVMLDVDHFKRINDSHGHDAGDRALQAVARALDGRRRAQDLLCRYGGEEFTLLLVGTNGAGALRVAEEMRQAVSALALEEAGGRVPLTLSAGVAAFPELHVKAASELLLLADAALYRAKEAGRNRCLLDVGGGRYRGVDGKLSAAGEHKPAPVPQLFA